MTHLIRFMKAAARLTPPARSICLLLSLPLLVVGALAAPPPVITLHPQGQTVPLGATATFFVEATSGTTLTYQWYFQAAQIAGATNSSCAIPNVQFTNAGTYYVAVRNAGGSVNSSNAVLTIKNAPVLSGANNLNPVSQDDSNNPGTRVSSLIANQVTDPDPGSLQGIAVVAVDNANGTWQFSTNGGGSWTPCGSPTQTAARLLPANTNAFVRFIPNTNWLGTVTNGLTFRAWDRTSGTTGGTADVTTNGGTTAFSASTAGSSVSVVNFGFVLVDTTSDLADGTTSSIGALVVNRGPDGRISFREAILAANNTVNAASGPDAIYFSIPDPVLNGAHTITVTSALPVITDRVLMDGTTDEDSPVSGPVIELNGAGTGAGVNGLILQADGCTVRGLAINRFSANGLVLSGNSNIVERVWIGVGIDGLSALGNGLAGILITGGNNTVGGDGRYQFNRIGGNAGPGILIRDATAAGNRVVNNRIGLGSDSLTLLPNAQGVRIENGAAGNRIGAAGSGLANRIVGNAGPGIAVLGTNTTNNVFLGNTIRASGGLAIDLNDDGVSADDVGDVDTGPNQQQNFPVLASATVTGSSLNVAGTLNSETGATYRIEFFRVSSGQADASGYGETESFLGQVSATTSGTGDAAFSAIFDGVVMEAGDLVTATATRDFGGGIYGDTSECAQNLGVAFVGTPGFDISVLSPLPLGNEVRANTTTNGDQCNYYWSIRTVALAPDGSFVKVWIDRGGLDGSQSGIYGQRFDPNGNKLEGEFLVNTTTAGSQDNASVSVSGSGRFVVCWDSGGDVYGQRFLANGRATGGEFRVNTTTLGTQKYPEVHSAPDGSFVVAWTGPNPSGGGNATLFQRYAANGNKIGNETVGHVFSGTSQVLDSLSVRLDGAFLITWTDTGDIYGRLFSSNGVPISAPLLLNATTAGTQQYSVGRTDGAGNFVVVWESLGQDGSGNGIFGRRFAPDGTPLTGEFSCTSQTAGDQYGAAIALDQFGNFVVGWTDGNALDGSGESVWVQRFDGTGQRVGLPRQVNQTTAGYQGYPVLAMNNSGRLVVGWEGIGPGDSYGVYVRRYQLDPVVTEGFTRTFTVALNTPPTASVTLNLSASDVTEAALSASSLTFSPTDWSLPQTVTITGVQDRLVDGDMALMIVTGSALSADPAYSGLKPDDIPMITLDSGAINTAPVAHNQIVTTLAAAPKAIVLTGSDANNDPLTFALVTPPGNGLISGFNTNTGALTYTPAGSFTGSDSFTFLVNDGFASSSPATVNVTVTAVADLVTTVTGPESVFANASFSYAITTTNLGPSAATDVVVSDALPAGATFVSASDGGIYDAEVVTWSLGSLDSGAAVNFTVAVIAPPDGTLINTVTSTSTTTDLVPTNNDGSAPAAQVLTTVTPVADVVTTVAGPVIAITNAPFGYTVAVVNLGPSIATSLAVSDTLPAGVVFLSASSGGAYNAGVVTWSLASLDSGAATNFTVTVLAPDVGSLVNTVASSAATGDPDESNNNGTTVAAQVVTGVYPLLLLTGQWSQVGGFQVEFHTYPDTICSILASTNLADWVTLITTNSGAGHVIFIDQDAALYPQRFYRSMQGP